MENEITLKEYIENTISCYNEEYSKEIDKIIINNL